MLNRETRGRVSGLLLFAFFLLFHLRYLIKRWPIFDPVARLNSLLITLTIILFLSAYLIRQRAVEFPHGFMETVYPLLCAILPLVIYHDVEILRYISPGRSIYRHLNGLFGLYSHHLLGWNLCSMTLIITGNLITLSGMVFLKRSFSLMVEARAPVYRGIYAYIRHPLYLGEMIATAGVLIFRFSNINMVLTLLFVLGQKIRAGIEEKKLIHAFPEYLEYRKKTGGFFPKWSCS
ncbi:MAG: hypothetical protein CO150_10330 [Nitrospirae bacterium CG_4_9_14_3_um_filter_53_35]|nr:MAG: hypothetical protein AUK29_10000 [Nitrospirae bacterium CG2_30_53_67]PIS36301.1 MAG: hypothetical protein COT35_11850 [Nitrospirae bacterium CG08_land_8_20_14_0_20_52_24]PIV85427.1 MAG: hypothetical protein COW52_02265 [Nitrospirae bacterium CG17_big_fil_post_rev_8_21_14_2_50_50_9]PIW85063.1 MAG: hypothetical protein COZ95_06525 [Nitrospirae bacterium CG_4_8_14_3_um_filter_50_41]PIX86003.1 MAG: hypothetical protein COZ32_05565 [Nitrospirae bacterium CG_4_10_14_3_um_filter_53_41]PJA7276